MGVYAYIKKKDTAANLTLISDKVIQQLIAKRYKNKSIFHTIIGNNWLRLRFDDAAGSYMAAVNNKGRCYIWSMSQTRLYPKHKIEAHNKYTLRCRFSPNSTLLVSSEH